MKNIQKTYQILLVDDEQDILSMLEVVLRAKKYIVHSSMSISEALNILEQNKDISLVISDIQMPGGTGLDLLKKIRAKYPVKPKVVFLTGFAKTSLDDACEGVSGYIEKPIDIKAFIQTVEDVLKG